MIRDNHDRGVLTGLCHELTKEIIKIDVPIPDHLSILGDLLLANVTKVLWFHTMPEKVLSRINIEKYPE